jgi:hypothetical protein
MNGDQEIDISEILNDRPRIQKALRDGVQKAMRMHKLLGRPVYTWQDGKVVEIPPEKIELLDEPNGNGKSDSHS